eukprot:m.81089 g.81089  ORF g.81089 m.81089 type:complete len:1416 (+) comp12623_c1_seq2:371-4618(+)
MSSQPPLSPVSASKRSQSHDNLASLQVGDVSPRRQMGRARSDGQAASRPPSLQRQGDLEKKWQGKTWKPVHVELVGDVLKEYETIRGLRQLVDELCVKNKTVLCNRVKYKFVLQEGEGLRSHRHAYRAKSREACDAWVNAIVAVQNSGAHSSDSRPKYYSSKRDKVKKGVSGLFQRLKTSHEEAVTPSISAKVGMLSRLSEAISGLFVVRRRIRGQQRAHPSLIDALTHINELVVLVLDFVQQSELEDEDPLCVGFQDAHAAICRCLIQITTLCDNLQPHYLAQNELPQLMSSAVQPVTTILSELCVHLCTVACLVNLSALGDASRRSMSGLPASLSHSSVTSVSSLSSSLGVTLVPPPPTADIDLNFEILSKEYPKATKDNLLHLVDFGFETETALSALHSHKNDILDALEELLRNVHPEELSHSHSTPSTPSFRSTSQLDVLSPSSSSSWLSTKRSGTRPHSTSSPAPLLLSLSSQSTPIPHGGRSSESSHQRRHSPLTGPSGSRLSLSSSSPGLDPVPDADVDTTLPPAPSHHKRTSASGSASACLTTTGTALGAQSSPAKPLASPFDLKPPPSSSKSGSTKLRRRSSVKTRRFSGATSPTSPHPMQSPDVSPHHTRRKRQSVALPSLVLALDSTTNPFLDTPRDAAQLMSALRQLDSRDDEDDEQTLETVTQTTLESSACNTSGTSSVEGATTTTTPGNAVSHTALVRKDKEPGFSSNNPFRLEMSDDTSLLTGESTTDVPTTPGTRAAERSEPTKLFPETNPFFSPPQAGNPQSKTPPSQGSQLHSPSRALSGTMQHQAEDPVAHQQIAELKAPMPPKRNSSPSLRPVQLECQSPTKAKGLSTPPSAATQKALELARASEQMDTLLHANAPTPMARRKSSLGHSLDASSGSVEASPIRRGSVGSNPFLTQPILPTAASKPTQSPKQSEQRPGSATSAYATLSSATRTERVQGGQENAKLTEEALQFLDGDKYDPTTQLVVREVEVEGNVVNRVRAGTIHGLIEHMMSTECSDPDMIQAFKMCFVLFTDASVLLDLLLTLNTACVRPRLDGFAACDDQVVLWRHCRSVSLLAEFLPALCVGLSWEAFLKVLPVTYDTLEVEQLDFAVQLMVSIDRAATLKRNQAISAKEHKTSKAVPTHNLGAKMPVPSKRFGGATVLSEPQSRSDITERLLEMKPGEVAQDLTLMDFELFEKVTVAEVLEWRKTQTNSPSVSAMVARFNTVSNWVATRIVSVKRLRDRAKVFKFMVALCKRLKELQSFNMLLAVLSGLNSASVYRLKHTLEASRCASSLAALNELMNRDKSYGNYRFHVNKLEPPLIPYLGLYLSDVTFVHLGNPTLVRIQGTELVNFTKVTLLYNICSSLDDYKAVKYTKPKDYKPSKLLTTMEFLSEEEMFKCSLALEPRNASIDEIE